MIHSFMDAYLRLGADELNVYNRMMETIDPPEREAVMQIVNQWEERGEQRGLKLGEERDIRVGEAAVMIRLLGRKFGEVPSSVREKIGNLPQAKLEELADAVLDFAGLEDATGWFERAI
jgi:predicted transposase YdaD